MPLLLCELVANKLLGLHLWKYINAIILFQVAAKCYQKGGAIKKEKLALAHDAVLQVQTKKISPK